VFHAVCALQVCRMRYRVVYGRAELASSPEQVKRIYGEYHDNLIWRSVPNESLITTLGNPNEDLIRQTKT
jgi:hypothetical protein